MRQIGITLVVGLSLAMLGGVTSATAKEVKIVKVDCTKGESINAVLGDKSESLIIEISGMCHEHVVIQRSYVTLIGTDPAVDGIKGPVEGGPYPGLVEVSAGAVEVELENLTMAGGGTRGIYVRNAGRVKVANCWLLDNGYAGFQAANGYAWILDTRLAGNGSMGARFSRGGRLICQRCVFENNGNWAVSSVESSYIYLDNSEISGENGVLAERGGFVNGYNNSSITAVDEAILVAHLGEVIWSGGEITGGILALVKTVVRLDSVKQGAGFRNAFHQDSTLEIENSSLLGNTTLHTFSNGAAFGSTVFGPLSCHNGGNLYCEGSVVRRPSPTTCGLCP